MTNPWLNLGPQTAPVVVNAAPKPPTPTGPTAPQVGVPVPDAGSLLPVLPYPGWAPVHVLGAHGGAGESALARLLPGAHATAHRWPSGQTAPSRVLVVARSNTHGLRSAQAAAQQWAAGLVPNVDLLGLVVMSDAPGKLPRPLRDQMQLVSGGFARSWHVPWIESWRIPGSDPSVIPREARRVVDELSALIITPN